MMVRYSLETMPTSRLHLLAALPLVLAALVIGIYWWRLDVANSHLQSDTRAQVELRAEELTSTVAGQTGAIIRTADFVLRHLRDGYARGRSIEDDVRSVYEGFPINTVIQVGVIDPDGYLAWSSLGVHGHVYLGDREHFKVHLDNDEDRLFISRPVLGRASGAWSIQITRPIRRKGKFAGVMVLSLSPELFAGSYANLNLNHNGIIALVRPDGAYLARLPELMEAMGKSIPADRPFIGADAPVHGTFQAVMPFDKVKRTFAWRRLDGYPVTVVLGIDETPVLLPIQKEISLSKLRAYLGSATVFLLSIAVSLLFLRAAGQQQALVASEMRHRSFFQKNTSIKLVIDPEDGRIVDANPAAVDYYGYPRETLLAMRIADINCLPAEQVQAEMLKAKSEQRIYFNFRHRLASGKERDVEVYSGPVEIEGKTLLFSIVHDVTARHELEKRLAASEELHRNLILAMAEGVVVVNGDGRISAWNKAALAILGIDAEGLKAHRSVLLGADGERLPVKDHPSMRAARGEQLDHALFGVLKPDGSQGWMSVSSRPLQTAANGENGKAVLSFSDISKLVAAEESLRLAQSVFDVAGEGILVTDADTRIIAVNPAFTALTGYEDNEVIGKKPSLLASGLHDAGFYAIMWQHLARDGHWEGEISNRRKDGSIFVEWLRISVIPERPGHGRRYVAMFSDITDRKREAETVWHQANFDELTGLANRKLLEDRLARAIAQAHRKHSTVAVLFIDLDRFKPVNDQYGHAAGDELLKQVARRLEHCLRDEDTIARLGGDEFVAVLPDLRMTEIPTKAAEKIVAVLSEPFHIGENFIEISCSVGVSLFPNNADNADALIAQADAAMYAAKQAGRSTWHAA